MWTSPSPDSVTHSPPCGRTSAPASPAAHTGQVARIRDERVDLRRRAPDRDREVMDAGHAISVSTSRADGQIAQPSKATRVLDRAMCAAGLLALIATACQRGAPPPIAAPGQLAAPAVAATPIAPSPETDVSAWLAARGVTIEDDESYGCSE